jgi:hypothetical protein
MTQDTKFHLEGLFPREHVVSVIKYFGDWAVEDLPA